MSFLLAVNRPAVVFGSMVVLGLYLARLYDYILFHSLVEVFTLVVGWSIFMVAWNSRHLTDNGYLPFLGTAYLFISGINLIHMLAYKGMNVFHGFDANLPTQLWIGMRFLESMSLLVAPAFLPRKFNTRIGPMIFGVVTLLLLLSILYWDVFPNCFIEGRGLTTFKVTSEYTIALILIGALLAHFRTRAHMDGKIFQLLVSSIVLSILSGLAFTLYNDVYGLFNLIGHLLRLFSFYLIYKGFIQTGIIKPFDLLFRNLNRSERKLYSLLEELPAFVYLHDSDYNIGFANRTFRETFGDPDGKKCYELLLGENRPCSDCPTMRVHNTREAQQREWGLIPGKTYQLFEYPFMDEDGTPQVLKLGIDITDRKKAEEALVKARDELEMHVTERTAELRELIRMLNNEIQERKRMEQALVQSERDLRQLSARLLTTQEEERKLIAMELHDSIGGALSAVKFGVENSLTQLSRQSGGLNVDALKAVIPMVQNAIDEVRRIHSGIWPSILEDLGVLMAIRWFLRQYGATYPHIVIDTQVGVDEEEIPEHLKIVIYRIMQEAFNNIGKHSGAASAHLMLTRSNDVLELTIEDDGNGFDVEKRSGGSEGGGGLGLSSMKERTKLSGGSYEIRSAIGEGTTVRASWALTAVAKQVA